jgi:hypothetical protein
LIHSFKFPHQLDVELLHGQHETDPQKDAQKVQENGHRVERVGHLPEMFVKRLENVSRLSVAFDHVVP